MFRTEFKKKFGKLAVVVSVLVLTLSATACSSHMFDDFLGSTDTDESEYTDVQKEFAEFLHDEYVESVTSDTLTYNYAIKDGDALGISEPEVSLGDADMSDEAIAEDKAEYDETYEKLKSFDRDELTEDQQLTYDILCEYMEVETLSYLSIYLYEPFAPMKGLQSNISTYFTDYRFDDKGDVERYIEVMGMVRDYFDAYLEFEKTKSEKGYFMSDAVCDEVIEQCEDFIGDGAENHFMIEVFNDNIEALDFLTDDEIAEYEEQNKQAVTDSLIPAFEDTIEVLTELKGTGTNDGGLCGYDGGKEYYEYLLKHTAGTDKTPEEVLSMLEENMNSLMTELYSIAMTDYESYEYFSINYDNLFGDTDSQSPTEIVNMLMETATENYPDFHTIEFNAENINENLEDIMENTLAYYMSPAYDDQDNNIIRVNGKHTDGMVATLAHEGYPGHMLQNAYFMSTDPEPIRTELSFLGYMEGWAMYASYDAIEHYTFDGAPNSENVAKLYNINDELSYLVSGIIDIGINYEGWTLEETRSYLEEQGFSSDSAEELYTTMIGDPAVYQSYSTGYYELKELRDYVDETYSDVTDKEFNTAVLTIGPCQFDILKEQLDETFN